MDPPVSLSMAPEGLADGPMGRWHPAWVAVVTLLLGFVAYLAIGGLAWIGILVAGGSSLTDAATGGAEPIGQDVMGFLAGNAIGLALGLGATAYLVARLVSSRPAALMRMNRADWPGTGLALLGLVAMLPMIAWLGEINESLPLPDFVRSLEEEQLALLEIVLSQEGSFFVKLFMVAATPALFEEIFFRGIIQRNFERAWGVAFGIAATGITFGLFHIRLTQALPLMVLGTYLAWLSWRTGSLWVPVIVHFANNAAALAYHAMPSSPLKTLGTSSDEAFAIPWVLVVVGTILFAVVVVVMHRRCQR